MAGQPDPLAPASRPLRGRDLALLLFTLIGGLLASLLNYHSLAEAERLRQEERFQAGVVQVRIALDQVLTRTVEAMRSAGLMVESQQELTRAEFMHYASHLAEDLPALGIVEWQPWVPGARRSEFERSAQAQGLKGYRIIDPGSDETSWKPAVQRAHYVPVLYGWPEGKSPLGFDLAANPLRMASKIESARRHRPVASASFPILQRELDAAPVRGFAISSAAMGEGDNPKGFMAAVVELPTLLRPVVALADAAGLELRLYEGPDAHGTLLQGPAQRRIESNPALQRRETIDVAGQQWTLSLQPAAPPAGSRRAEIMLAVGLITTLLLATLLWRAQREHGEVESTRARLQREQQRLANVAAGTRAATWELDFLTREHHVNEYWESLGGYAPGEYSPGRNYQWRVDCHPADQSRVADCLRRHLKGETDIYEVEYRHRHKTQGWVWVQSRGRVLTRDPDGRARLMAGTLIDIQARKQAEARILELNSTLESRVAERSAELEKAMESLRESREKLAQAEARAMLSTLVASLAHELNTPLGSSSICAQNLVDQVHEFRGRQSRGPLRRAELDGFVEQVQQNAELVHRNLLRATELIGRFRQTAADAASEQRRPFDLATMAQELLATLAPLLQRQPQKVRLEIPPGIAMDSYPGPLAQVLINLINNALAHAFPAGTVGEVLIRARDQGDQVVIEVRDNGRGMDEATRARLFQPYFSTRIGQGGTGLGLAIVDNLVRKTLGGRIEVHSQPGRGCRIEINLPLRAPLPKPAQA